MTEAVRIGLIGCGTISPAYLRAAETFKILNFVACADINPDASAATNSRFGIPNVTVDQLLANDEIEVVLNLTIPAVHAEINESALESGKHAYCEKPFGLQVDEGRTVLELAQSKGLRVGCAPDTFLGGGHQTVRKLVDEGAIGEPVAATAFMMSHGVETWHPSPIFYYKRGGGPVFDMAPYYLTALVNCLGPIARVSAITGRAFDERTITSQPLAGEVIEVEVATHASSSLEFESGAIATVCMSFDVWAHRHPNIELHGTKSSMVVPDPNGFGGKVLLPEPGRGWKEQELTHGYTGNMRSIGLADMCMGIRTDRPHRANGDLAFHVLEVMAA
ncbi:MAG: Gfo/Idh/MocA family oxidoreductase, partial [Gammaproteobacteria bacterium]|nr:Gfo/Idh/MocA family oxidoreductase [Gammaproteobacteria bacterium]